MVSSRLLDFLKKQPDTSVMVTDIPYIHPMVALEDLHPNGCLLSDEQIQQLKLILPNLHRRRSTKVEVMALLSKHVRPGTKWPYAIYKQEHEIYIVYKGVKHDKHLGEGAHGTVKLVQRLSDKQFFVLKLQTENLADAINEFTLLRKIGETAHQNPIKHRNAKDKEDESVVHEQYSIIMKLARGRDILDVTSKEAASVGQDADGNLIIMPGMPPLLRLQLVLSMLEKLDDLHRRQHIIHRDLQPRNIIVDRIGQQAYLIDYGLALEMNSPRSLRGSQRRLSGSTRNLANELRKRIPEAVAAANFSEDQKPLFTYDESSEMNGIGITIAYFLHVIDEPPLNLPITEWQGSYIVGARHAATNVGTENETEAYISNVLPQPVMDKMVAFLHSTTAEDPKKRISFAVAIKYLAEMINELKMVEANHIPVCIVDVADIRTAAELALAIPSIKSTGAGEVWLIDSTGFLVNDRTLQLLKRQMEEADLHVGDKYFAGSDIEALKKAVQAHLATRSIPSSCMFVPLKKQLIIDGVDISRTPSPRLFAITKDLAKSIAKQTTGYLMKPS